MPSKPAPAPPLFTDDEEAELARIIFRASIADSDRHGPASRVLSFELQGDGGATFLALLVVQPGDANGFNLHALLRGVCEQAISHTRHVPDPDVQERTRWLS